MVRKKNLEIQTIRDNKRQEIINEILDNTTNLDQLRKSNKKVSKKIIAAGAHVHQLNVMMSRRRAQRVKVEKELSEIQKMKQAEKRMYRLAGLSHCVNKTMLMKIA